VTVASPLLRRYARRPGTIGTAILRRSESDKTPARAMHAIDDRPAFIVHSWKHVAAVLRAAEQARRPVWLFTPVAASYSFGVGFWAAIQERIAELHPEADARVVIDCDDAAGHVLAALRSGLRWLVFEGNAAARRRLLDIVAQSGAELVQRRADALDLLQVKDADNDIAAHLGS
jgi:hypothetical protein